MYKHKHRSLIKFGLSDSVLYSCFILHCVHFVLTARKFQVQVFLMQMKLSLAHVYIPGVHKACTMAENH